jgi:hypothetical protein
MTTSTVTKKDFERLTDTIDRWRVQTQAKIEKHDKTLYGNGEPGMDEQIRGIHTWINEQRKAADKRSEFWSKFSWLIITLVAGGFTAFIGQALYFWFRVVPEISKLTGN